MRSAEGAYIFFMLPDLVVVLGPVGHTELTSSYYLHESTWPTYTLCTQRTVHSTFSERYTTASAETRLAFFFCNPGQREECTFDTLLNPPLTTHNSDAHAYDTVHL